MQREMAKRTTPAALAAVPLALRGAAARCLQQIALAISSLKNKSLPSPCLQIWTWAILSEVRRKTGNFGGAPGQRDVGAELGSGWVGVTSPRWGLGVAPLPSARWGHVWFLQPFISLFIKILHIKICVGSQKRAASTQYSTQQRGSGISGSVLWDLDWGGRGW